MWCARDTPPAPRRAFSNAPGDGSDAGEEFVDDERFGDVVVGTGVEGVDLVAAVGTAGEHDDRDDGPASQTADHLGAVHVGQAEIEDHQVGVLPGGHVQR